MVTAERDGEIPAKWALGTVGHCPDDGGCPNSSLEAKQRPTGGRETGLRPMNVSRIGSSTVSDDAQVLRWALSTQSQV